MKPDCSKKNPYYVDHYPEEAGELGSGLDPSEVVCDDYVRVMCWEKSACLQIREDIIRQSQVMEFLASGRPAENLAECIHLQNSFATLDRMKIICDWLATHIEFESRDASHYDREEFDRCYFLLNVKGKKMYKQLKDILKVGPSTLSDPLFKPKKKNYFEDKMKKIKNKDLSTFTPDELNDTFNIVIKDEIKNILDPFAEVTRHKKYHRSLEELCPLYTLSVFLELHPTYWHTEIEKKILENETNLSWLYPCSQFEYLNIKQRIFCETSSEILIYHIINNLIAKPIIKTELSHVLKAEFMEKIKSKIENPDVIGKTSTKNDLYNIILIYNNYVKNYWKPNWGVSLENTLAHLPLNYKSLSFNVHNNHILNLFFTFDCLINYHENYKKNECNFKSDANDDIKRFCVMFNCKPFPRKFKDNFIIKIYSYLLTILAYNSSEGKNQRDYRIAYMDNPDPVKKYKNGVSGELRTENFDYPDSYDHSYTQHGGPLNKDLIEHFMP
jgi:hypothetical protein